MDKKKKLPEIRKNNPLYLYCSEEWHSIIDTNQTIHSVKKGGEIFSQGNEVSGIYILLEGKAKVVSPYEKEKERIHRLANEGKLLGHRGFGTSRYPVSAIALTDVKVSYIPNKVFINIIKTNPELSIYLLNFFADELRESEERMKNMMLVEVKNRIAFILLDLISTFGFDSAEPDKLNYSLSRKDFASMAGTTYETVVRTLASFQQNKLIRLIGKSIYINNIKGIKSLV